MFSGKHWRRRLTPGRKNPVAAAPRRAVPYRVEGLEGRVLLAVSADSSGLAERFHARALTAQDMLALDVSDVQWQGRAAYAMKNQWVIDLALPAGEGAGAAAAALNALGLGYIFTDELGRGDLAVVRLPDGAGGSDLAAALSSRGLLDLLEPNFIGMLAAVPNDTYYVSKQWPLNNTGGSGGVADADIDAPEAWDITTGSSSLVTAVIDTGVDYTHPDLAANMWTNPLEVPGDGVDNELNGYIDDVYGIDTINGDSDPMDDNRHGTHVAGIIGAAGNNAAGIAGVAWQADIMAVKIMTADGFLTTASLVDGLNYVTKMRRDFGINVRVTNNSYGGFPDSGTIQQAIQDMQNQGILFVAAAGNSTNDNDRAPSYPDSYGFDNIISVAATDRRDALAGFSSFGETTVDLAAPGVDVWSTLLNSSYGLLSGTSMAAPHVAGVAALAFSAYPAADWRNVKDALVHGADWLVGLHGKMVSGGRLNAKRTLDLLRAPLAFVDGTAGNDIIEVRLKAGDATRLQIDVNGTVTEYAVSAVSWVRLRGLGGNDTIRVNEANGAVTLPLWADGGPGNDALTGGSGEDRLFGGEGDDTLDGAGGRDLVTGGVGHDPAVRGGAGDDIVIGYDGNDALFGDAGNDSLLGEAGDDDLDGNAGNDAFVFKTLPDPIGVDKTLGTDVITEAANLDVDTVDLTYYTPAASPLVIDLNTSGTRLSGGTKIVDETDLILYQADITAIENARGTVFADLLRGNSRNNTLFGQGGDDILEGGATTAGADTFWGSDGLDTADYSMRAGAVNISLDNAANDGATGEGDNVRNDIETVIGGGGNDTLTGGSLPVTLQGSAGNDTLRGGGGDDVLEGGAGADTVYGMLGNDEVYGSTKAGDDTGDLADTLYGDDPAYTGVGGSDTINGGAGSDWCYGGYGNDLLEGGSGSDTLLGEDGDDTFKAKDNEIDTLYGGFGVDTARLATDRDTDDLIPFNDIENL